MRDTVITGGFALLLLFLLAMHVGSQPAMLACVMCGFASWLANMGTEADEPKQYYVGVGLALLSGAYAFGMVALRISFS